MRSALLGGLLLAFAPSCLSVNYVRFSVGEPVPDEALATLEPGRADLAACLARLGAPDLVWPSDRGALQLAWAWLDAAEWGASLSYSLERFVPARAKFDGGSAAYRAVVLRLGPDLVLQSIARGLLRDLVVDPQERDAVEAMLDDAPR